MSLRNLILRSLSDNAISDCKCTFGGYIFRRFIVHVIEVVNNIDSSQ